MSAAKIKTGILSFGMSGQVFHAPFVEQDSRFDFRAIVERSTKKAKERYPNVISYDSVAELLADPAIELVIVNTPNDTHFDYVIQALEAGKHVLVEKPFAATSAQAKQLFELGRKVGKHVMVFQNRRWDSDFKSLKQVLKSGFVGNPIELHVRFDRYRIHKSHKIFKETKDRAASGVLYDLGPHMLDQVISLFGRPDRSLKICKTHRPDSEVDDFSTLVLNYNDGPVVFIHASLLVAQPLVAYVCHGTAGSFQKDRVDVQEEQLLAGMIPADVAYGVEPVGKEGVLTVVKADGDKEVSYCESLKGNYSELFDAVALQIQDNVPFPVKEEEIVWQLEILEQSPWNK